MDMTKSKLSKSIRKYIRGEKAKIRKTFSNPEEAERKVKELIQKFITND